MKHEIYKILTITVTLKQKEADCRKHFRLYSIPCCYQYPFPVTSGQDQNSTPDQASKSAADRFEGTLGGKIALIHALLEQSSLDSAAHTIKHE